MDDNVVDNTIMEHYSWREIEVRMTIKTFCDERTLRHAAEMYGMPLLQKHLYVIQI